MLGSMDTQSINDHTHTSIANALVKCSFWFPQVLQNQHSLDTCMWTKSEGNIMDTFDTFVGVR